MPTALTFYILYSNHCGSLRHASTTGCPAAKKRKIFPRPPENDQNKAVREQSISTAAFACFLHKRV